MTIQEALNFSAIYPELSSLKMPFSLAFKFHKINLEATSASDFYREKLQTLISEYAQKDEEGQLIITENGISLKPETVDECQQKLQELQSVEWKAENLFFTEKEKEMFNNFELTPIQMEAIFPFL